MTNPLLAVPDLPAIAHAAHAAGAVLRGGRHLHLAGAAAGARRRARTTRSTPPPSGSTATRTRPAASSPAPRARIDPLRGARVLEGALLGPVRGLAHAPRAAHPPGPDGGALDARAPRRAAAARSTPRVARVLYPGLPDHPDHAIARALLHGGFGGMVAFEIDGAGPRRVLPLPGGAQAVPAGARRWGT